MPSRALRAHEVGRHHRLAVARRERVDGAPREGRQQQEDQHALAGRSAREHACEAVSRAVARGAHVPAVAFRRRQGAVAGVDREVGDAVVERARQHVRGVVAQPVGRVSGGRARAHGGACAGVRHHGLPAHPVRERLVRDDHVAGVRNQRAQRQLDARELQPALSGRVRDQRAGEQLERHSPAVDGQREAVGHLRLLAREHGRHRGAPLLEGGDLGLVQDVVDVHAVGGDPHLREVVDREVPERVRRGPAAHSHQGEERERDDDSGAQRQSAEPAAARDGGRSWHGTSLVLTRRRPPWITPAPVFGASDPGMAEERSVATSLQ